MKRIVAGMLGLLLCAGGAGCQPTPAAEPVPYQGHDPVDNAPSTEASEKIDAPPRVENSFTDAATGLTVIFDCEVKTPEVSGYSILVAKAVQLSPADFAAAIEALCPGRPLLQAPVRTQAEWGAYITRCKQNLGESDPGYIQYLTEQMMNAPQAYEPVPFHLEDIGAGEAFEAYFPGEEGAYGVLSGTMGGNSFYYSRDQEAGCIGEDDLEPGLDDAMLGDYQGDFPISAQEALPYARAALAALGQADAEQAYVGKMCAYAYGGLYAKGWKFVFTHGANGLPSLYASETVTFGGDGLPLPTLCSPWGQELIFIFVDAQGVLMVNAVNMIDPGETIVENAALLPFSQLTDGIRQHLVRTFFYLPERVEQAAIKVTGMELCAATVTAKNDPEAGRMIPAWKVCFQTMEGSQTILNTHSRYFSAIDGSYIEPRITSAYLG